MTETSILKPITDRDTLRSLYGEPIPVAVAIMKPALDAHHRRFIEHAPFLCIATADEHGQPALSPKGDAPGFVTILDDHTLLIPDRPGNRKLKGLQNLCANVKVALLFMVPGLSETLRIEGEARIALDDDLLESGKVRGKRPPSALVVTVRQVYFHCGKAMVRSNLWDPETRVPAKSFPSFGQILADQAPQAKLDKTKADALVEHVYKEELY